MSLTAPHPLGDSRISPRRLPELDVLRGIAILLVLGHHVGITPEHLPTAIQAVLDVWAMAGWVGVDLFFVLSGFLVSGLLFREYQSSGSVRVGRFLVRRGFKIYPAFYTLIIVTTAVDGWLKRPTSPRGLLGEVLFVQNYVGGLWTHTWSLAVEEHFYLLLGALVAGLIAATRASRGRAQPFAPVIPVFLGVAGFALLARIVTAVLAPPVLALHLTPTHLRLDSLMFGVVLSYLFHFHSRALALHVRTHRSAIVLLCIACLGPSLLVPVTSVFMETIGFTLLYVGFGGVLLLALHRTSRLGAVRVGPRRVTPLTAVASGLGWLGVYSYSIYLWHVPVQAWSTIAIARITGWLPPPTVAWAMYFVGAIGVGVLMTWLIERPGLALRERIAGRAQKTPAVLGRAA